MTASDTYTCLNCKKPLTASELGGKIEGTEWVVCKDCRPQLLIAAIISQASKAKRDLSLDELRKIIVLEQGKGIEAITDLKLREADPRAQEVHLTFFRLNDKDNLEFGFHCLQCGREAAAYIKDQAFPAKSEAERYGWIVQLYGDMRDGLPLLCGHCGHQHVLVK